MNKQGILIVISGFSGAGKGTIIKKLIEEKGFALSVSATTRKPREGEIDGQHYFFVSKEEFENMIKNNKLIEWAIYCDNYYGTPKEYVEKQLNAGKDVILEIEIQGALQVKKKFPDSLLIFITAPSAYEIKNRLINRGTESLEIINKRLKKAYEEIDAIEDYDYIVVNDKLEETVTNIKSIITAEHERVTRNKDLKIKFKNQFEDLLKGGL